MTASEYKQKLVRKDKILKYSSSRLRSYYIPRLLWGTSGTEPITLHLGYSKQKGPKCTSAVTEATLSNLRFAFHEPGSGKPPEPVFVFVGW